VKKMCLQLLRKLLEDGPEIVERTIQVIYPHGQVRVAPRDLQSDAAAA
jgi:hypothetical protein